MDNEEVILKRLLATFKAEAAEHVAAISSALVELEKTRGAQRRRQLTEAVFREAHSLKGAARTVGAAPAESVSRAMEEIFAHAKREDAALPAGLFDPLHRACDAVLALTGDDEKAKAERHDAARLVADLEAAASRLGGEAADAGAMSAAAPPPEGPPDGPQGLPHLGAETTRVEKGKLDSLLFRAEGLLGTKQALEERADELRSMVASVAAMQRRWAMAQNDAKTVGRHLRKTLSDESPRVSASASRLGEFFASVREMINAVYGGLSSLEKRMEDDHRRAATMVDGLLDDAKRISMTPFSALFDLLPRTVRDLLADQGKQAELTLTGADVEVDRRILEEMKDPFIHLVRNAVDHGVDSPAERCRRGRPPVGRISVSVSHRDSGKVELVVADDGPGIDMAKVRSSAVRLGVVSDEDADSLDADRVRALVFRSGVSTSPLVTDLSGRGLGLAIVQEKVERLGGVVSCEPAADGGTLFRILLPTTLAAVKGLLVRLGDRPFVIPTAYVGRALRVAPEDVRTIEGRETVFLDGSAVPLVRLGDVLGVAPKRENGNGRRFASALTVAAEEKRIALTVDEVADEQEFLVKGLGRQLKRVRNVSGATVLPGGQMACVLNVPDMIKSAVRGGAEAAPAVPSRPAEAARKSLLVVEDSVTARVLLKTVLEAAGYDVKTAVDGLDGYALLKTEPFDLVVSDVDMPRMNGLELTAKIRADEKLADLPVILVTALDSPEDRERGVDAGANAYIVKSRFDQSNLLEVIKRLV